MMWRQDIPSTNTVRSPLACITSLTWRQLPPWRPLRSLQVGTDSTYNEKILSDDAIEHWDNIVNFLRNTHKESSTTHLTREVQVWGLYFEFGYYSDVIMGPMVFQITSLKTVYPTVYSVADQRKHQSSASLALVRGIHRWPVNSPHKWPVTWKLFPFDDAIMTNFCSHQM